MVRSSTRLSSNTEPRGHLPKSTESSTTCVTKLLTISSDTLSARTSGDSLEQVNELLPGTQGLAIFLSNYPPFWNPVLSDRLTNDAQFRVHEGRELSGTLVWGESSKSPEKPVTLSGTYTARWKPYSKIPGVKNAQFRYLAVGV